jgi:hypothetical protein
VIDYTRKRIAMNRHDAWDLRCGFLENELSRTRYGYAMTPWPTLGGLDLAGLFMDRKKFISTGVYFSELILLGVVPPVVFGHGDVAAGM